MFAKYPSPSLCSQSELQCWRRILRRKQFVNPCNSVLRRPRPQPSPHPPPQKACDPSLQSPHRESLSLYQVIDLRPRAALPSAASRVTFGREQHDSRPQIDNVSVTRLTFNRASALCRPASPPLSSHKKNSHPDHLRPRWECFISIFSKPP